jgi:acetyl esterase/lipase
MSGTCLSNFAAACRALPRNSRAGALLSSQQCKPGWFGRLPAQLALTAEAGLVERQRATEGGLIRSKGLSLTDRSRTPSQAGAGVYCRARNIALRGCRKVPLWEVEDRQMSMPNGNIATRIYRPVQADGVLQPAAVYFHGGLTARRRTAFIEL